MTGKEVNKDMRNKFVSLSGDCAVCSYFDDRGLRQERGTSSASAAAGSCSGSACGTSGSTR